MWKLKPAKSVRIETCESLILMSASGVDALHDASTDPAEDTAANDEDAAAVEQSVAQAEESSSFLSRLRDALSLGDSNRRRSLTGFDTIARDIQSVEPRLLLSAHAIAGATTITATCIPAGSNDEVAAANENHAPFLRFLEITQARAGVDGTGQVDAHDPDGDPLSYSIIGGRHADRFEIDADTGRITFRHIPEFSNPDVDIDPQYHVVVRVSDGQLHRDQEVLFTENPNLLSSNPSSLIIVPENSTDVGFQSNATTADRGFRLTGPDADLFQPPSSLSGKRC